METIMSTLALLGTVAAAPLETSKPAEPRLDFFRRLLEAREARARQHCQRYLAEQSDGRLRTLGFSPDDIEALRNGAPILPSSSPSRTQNADY
jgi:hypothetical protein